MSNGRSLRVALQQRDYSCPNAVHAVTGLCRTRLFTIFHVGTGYALPRLSTRVTYEDVSAASAEIAGLKVLPTGTTLPRIALALRSRPDVFTP